MFSAGNYHLVISELRVARGRGQELGGEEAATWVRGASLHTSRSRDTNVFRSINDIIWIIFKIAMTFNLQHSIFNLP